MMLPDASEVARAVTVSQVLRALGARIRNRKRADCLLCKGSSRGTLAFTERLWRCHRCNEGGGDVFSLVRAVRRCSFPEALRYVAEFGGVSLADSNRADFRREIKGKRQQREHIDRSARFLAEMERYFRLDCRNKIHQCDRTVAMPGTWDSAQWQRARAADVLLRDFLLPEYTLLAFGNMTERVRYVLASTQERASRCGFIREAGGTHTDSGFFVEVMS